LTVFLWTERVASINIHVGDREPNK
jgi:hypothetical protein